MYRLRADCALVATLDFFTPVVDDPWSFGAAAAANALSDVYAMGGRPALVLNICCFPRDLPVEVQCAILRGGADKTREAGAVLVGGHSVTDPEPKYGLVALGFVHPDRMLTKIGARPGDVLVLTKPLGVGIVTTALKRDVATVEEIAATTASMLQLNAAAAELLVRHGATAATDVTGFALVGHALELARKSGVQIEIEGIRLQFLPGARAHAEQGVFPGGTRRNERAYAGEVTFVAGGDPLLPMLVNTPETSGGLLATVPADRLVALLGDCAAAGQTCWEIGRVLPAGPGATPLRFT